MDSETVGLATIAIGLILAIGVVRGTWKKVFADVGLSGSGGAPAARPAPGNTTTTSLAQNQPMGANQQTYVFSAGA